MIRRKAQIKYFSSKEELSSFLNLCYEFVSEKMKNENGAHSFSHTLRVTNIAYHLAHKLGAAIDIVLIASLFHDISRPLEKRTGVCHAENGANEAEKFLLSHQKSELVDEVCCAIRSHRFSKRIIPETKEGKILKDADMLDALGAIGLYRVISYSVEHNRDFDATHQHFYDKLLILPSLMHFPLTKKLARKRCKLLTTYLRDLNQDIKNEDFAKILDSFK